MPGEFTATVDTTRYRNAMAGLRDALLARGQDVEHLLRDEGKLLAQTVTNFTPPLRGNGPPRKVGEQAIERGLTALFTEYSPGFIDSVGSQHGIQSVDTWRTIKGRPVHLIWTRIDPLGERLSTYHDQYRRKNGIVNANELNTIKRANKDEWRSIVAVPQGARANYIRLVQSHVGRWKATWAQAVAALGGKVPGWIARHFDYVKGTSGVDLSGLAAGADKSLTITSGAPGNSRIAQRIRDAVRTRTRAIIRRTRLVISGYSSPFVQVGDMIGAVETEGGSGSATYDVTNPSPPGAASANNSVFEVTAAYPAGSFAGGDAGFTYHSRLEISRSNICSIDPADALNGSGPYEACKDILDQIDLGDLEREYSLFGDPATSPSPTKLEMHNIYLIRPTWPVDGYGSAINGRPFYWAISPIFGFWDETHGVEIGAPNGDLISTSSWENFKVHIYQTNAGGLLAAQNQWVQGTETNLGSHYNGALILSKARAIEDVQAGHVFYPENRPRESLGWTTDDGIPTNVDGFGSYDQFPTSPTPCHSVGNGDLRFEVPGYGVGVIYRRAQHAFYTTYDETTGEYIEHERPACWNWPPCIGCEEGI